MMVTQVLICLKNLIDPNILNVSLYAFQLQELIILVLDAFSMACHYENTIVQIFFHCRRNTFIPSHWIPVILVETV